MKENFLGNKRQRKEELNEVETSLQSRKKQKLDSKKESAETQIKSRRREAELFVFGKPGEEVPKERTSSEKGGDSIGQEGESNKGKSEEADEQRNDNTPMFFKKVRCRYLIKMILEDLGTKEAMLLRNTLQNKRFQDILNESLKTEIDNLWNSLQNPAVESIDTLQLFINYSVNLNEYFLAHCSFANKFYFSDCRYFLSSREPNLTMKLSKYGRDLTIENSLMYRTTLILDFRLSMFNCTTHFQYLKDFNPSIIIIYNSKDVLLYNFERGKLEKKYEFCACFAYYCQAADSLVFLRNYFGDILIIRNEPNNEEFRMKFFYNQIDMLDVSSVQPKLALFYSSSAFNPKEIYVVNISRHSIVSKFNSEENAMRLYLKDKDYVVACYSNYCKFWKANSDWKEWQCEICFEFNRMNFFNQIHTINYLPEISPFCFLIFDRIEDTQANSRLKKKSGKITGTFLFFQRDKRYLKLQPECLSNLKVRDRMYFSSNVSKGDNPNQMKLTIFQLYDKCKVVRTTFALPKSEFLENMV